LEERLQRRNALARRYIEGLRVIPGVDFPRVAEGDRSTYKDFTILIDADGFGLDASTLALALAEEGIDTRHYYAPPVHMQRAYRFLRASANGSLPVTEKAAGRVLTLPLWSAMSDEQIDRVTEAVGRIQRHMGERPRVIRLP